VISNVDSPARPGPISASRYRIYGELFAELSQSRY
jgi:ribosome biogenesis GTPase